VVVTGMGKSGLIGQKIAATLTSTGTPAIFLHPTDALHGDLGIVSKGDVAIIISKSGETDELFEVLSLLKRAGVRIIALSGKPDSPLAAQADVVLDVSVKEEACPHDLVPTTSTTAALAMGDALAVALLEKKGFTARDFAAYHPGGRLGKEMLVVADLMHSGEAVPIVPAEAPLSDAVREMSAKKLGMTCVSGPGSTLAGILTDGDLRRLLQKGVDLLSRKAGECMTPEPKTISSREPAAKALQIMEARKITSLVVVDSGGGVEGVIHIHDLWRTQLF